MTTKVDPGPEAGERIGAYRVVRRLATGGTSDVLLAKAEGPHGFERTVVLKVLLSHFGKDDEVARMFAREAAAYARLSHPAIVRLFDFFAVPAAEGKAKGGGQLVMVLEHVDGPPLARLKSMVKAIGKELDDKAAVYVAACIFSALAAAHSATDDNQIPAPVIHRDVNPSNVLVPWDGYPKLADFGIAKVTGLGHHSVVGMVKGTYGYMAPEQVTGQEAVTPRSDVYAAGIILWELLTRRRAFQRGALPEIEALRAMAEPRLPALESIRSDVDRTVRDALRRALEPRAEKRKITAEEMASILSAVVPLDVGRERLMSLLGLVRNDARAANAQASIAPPPMPAAGVAGAVPGSELVIPTAPKAPALATHTMHGVAPPPAVQGIGLGGGQTPSRTMPKAAARPRASGCSRPRRPRRRRRRTRRCRRRGPRASACRPRPRRPRSRRPCSRRRRTSRASASCSRSRPGLRCRPSFPLARWGRAARGPPPQPNRAGSRARDAGRRARAARALEPPRRPSAAARLASSIPDADPKIESVPPTRPLAMFEGLGDSFPPGRLSHPPDSPRAGAPLKDLTGGLGLRDAIDEIMKGVPASASMAAAKAVTRPPPAADDAQEPTAVLRETTRVPPNVAQDLVQGFSDGRDIGNIPPAPPPMQADYPNAHDGDDEPVDTVVQEPPPPTPRMLPVNLSSTVAMESRPMPSSPAAAASPAAASSDAKTTTGAMPRYTPPPQGFGQTTPLPAATASPPSSGAILSQPANSQNPPRPAQLRMTTDPPSERAEKKGMGVGTVAILLVLVVAAGVAGTVALVRYQATKAVEADVPPSASEVVPSASSASSASVSAVPDVMPPVDAGVVVADAAPVVPATAEVDAAAVEGVPEGMGIVRTTGAAPGRRIFVDEKVAGQTPESITVKCGAHAVRLGSTGKAQDVDVPCGGEIVVGDVK
ncbi:MAG: serine/threonine protein kinase [Labilithrix sp.]|nr:serine/threonine protein kinase [Labilithrix sp.]